MQVTLEAGAAAAERGDLSAAEAIFRRLTADQPDDFRAWFNLAVVLRRQRVFEGALPAFRRSIDLAPAEFAPLRGLGSLALHLGDFAGAAALLQRALALRENQDARHELALSLLGAGRYQEGWAAYEARRGTRSTPRRAPFAQWQGEPIAGKSIVAMDEQGFGDVIMMARYLPLLRDLGCEVTWVCHPSLARLLEPLGARVVLRDGAVALTPHDYGVMQCSLPGLLGTTLETVPPPAAFRASPRTSSARVGVCIKGNPKHGNDALRSLPPAQASRLLNLPGATSLLPGDTGARDFQDTADLIAGLELVVTVDTSIAHLSASLGVPTWILLPRYGLDWRWTADREQSPWYPAARLFRQRIPGDWDGVIDDVEDALSRLSRAPPNHQAGPEDRAETS